MKLTIPSASRNEIYQILQSMLNSFTQYKETGDHYVVCTYGACVHCPFSATSAAIRSKLLQTYQSSVIRWRSCTRHRSPLKHS